MDNEEQLLELGLIRKDLFRFLKYVKIQEPEGLKAEYQLWPHLINFYNNLLTVKWIDLVKSKQIGISWALAIYALWKIMTVPGFNVIEISRGGKEAQKLLAKSGIVFDNLPDWIKKQPCFALDHNSTERLSFLHLKSMITAFTSTEVAGIGETAGLVIHDESDFHDYYETNLTHTRATVADGLARSLVSVSTTDKTKPDSFFKRHWKMGEGSGYPEAGQNNFKALFYGYEVRPNRDQAFFDAQVRESVLTPWEREANYPRTAVEALSPQSALSCFKKEAVDTLWENAVEPIETRQGFIHIFSKPRVGVTYVAGGDVGEGVGLAYSSLTIVGKDGLNSEVVAVIYSNKIPTDSFAFEVDKLCREYLDCELAVENNSIGNAVMNKLVELGYPRIFSTEVERKRKAGSQLSGNEKMGWITSGGKGGTKYTAVVELIENVNNGSLTTVFKPQIKEMMEYQWVNALPEPTGATHGDTVISLMLANQMLKRVGVRQGYRTTIPQRVLVKR